MEQQRELTPGIISPELDCPAFVVGDTVYTRTATLTVARGRYLGKLLTELHFGAGYRGLLETFDKGWAALNAGKLGDGIFQFGLMREKLNLIGANRLVEAEIVGLFYNYPGEDPGEFDYAELSQKVYTEWAAVDKDFFFAQALALLTTTAAHYPPAPTPPLLPKSP